jgi:hypothetical protein
MSISSPATWPRHSSPSLVPSLVYPVVSHSTGFVHPIPTSPCHLKSSDSRLLGNPRRYPTHEETFCISVKIDTSRRCFSNTSPRSRPSLFEMRMHIPWLRMIGKCYFRSVDVGSIQLYTTMENSSFWIDFEVSVVSR